MVWPFRSLHAAFYLDVQLCAGVRQKVLKQKTALVGLKIKAVKVPCPAEAGNTKLDDYDGQVKKNIPFLRRGLQ